MSLLSTSLTSLTSLVAGISDFQGRTGMSLGGQSADPASLKIPLPAAWILYAGRVANEKPRNGLVPKPISTNQRFVIQVFLPNADQTSMISQYLPILEKVISVVNGAEVLPGAYRFAFEVERMTSINTDRIVYEQHFVLTSSI